MEEGKSLYQFGPFSLDAVERVLLREGRVVPLPAKALSTLLVLVRNSRHLVEKDVLMNEVWPDEPVEEGNLAQHIFTLRKALGKTTDGGKYIETIPRRGYRFLEAIREIDDAAIPAAMAPQSRPKDQRTEGQASGTPLSLAVLPFVNANGNPKTEPLSDKLTESIINSLSQVPGLRVMSRSAVFRYKARELDAQRVGTELGVDAVLLGTVSALDSRLLISAELVDVANGWQLWGENYERWSEAIVEVQDEIAKQISTTLLRLSREGQQWLTKLNTENAAAHLAYVKGRRNWAKHTRAGLEQAIDCFRQAINLDPAYALAYTGIVDCYLRLATNYLPPADDLAKTAAIGALELEDALPDELQASLEIRFAWDLKAMERELNRASEFKANYPTVYQWHAAYLFARDLYAKTLTETKVAHALDSAASDDSSKSFEKKVLGQFRSTSLTATEEVQIFCAIAREQIEVGNYEASYSVLNRWWTFGEWPRLEGLGTYSSADLLSTVGTLAGFMASAKQVPRGQKHAEALLNGAIALFEQLGLRMQVAESQIELAICYYREGMFTLAGPTLLSALSALSSDNLELRSLGLIRLAFVEWQAGRLHDGLSRLDEAAGIVELVGPLVIGRYHSDLATLLQILGKAETRSEYFDQALEHYATALLQWEAVGNHRSAAVLEANIGYLLLTLDRLDQAEPHLVRARKWFDALADERRRALVDESLAEFHVAAGRLDLAEQAIARAVGTFESSGQEAFFAQTLRTQGVVLCRLERFREAKRVLDRAHRVAERCGDSEGAGSALLIVIEEMCEQLEDDERLEIEVRLNQLLAGSQEASTLERLGKCLELIAAAHARNTN